MKRAMHGFLAGGLFATSQGLRAATMRCDEIIKSIKLGGVEQTEGLLYSMALAA